MMMRAALLLPTVAAVATAATPWEHVGPRNIFDDEDMNGEAGTLADAASPAANPDLIYAGGRNNGASPGVLKSTDMGRHWVKASNGLLDTRINAIFLHPGESDGSHVLVGTDSGVWQSTSGGASWAHVNGTAAYGQVTSFALGRIGGAEHILASTAAGIANIPVTPDGEWAVINSTYGHDPHQLSVAVDGDTTVLAMCPCWAAVKPCPAYGGSVVLGTITSPTSADWRAFPALTCHVTAIDPNDKTHFIYSNGSVTGKIPIWESRDCGKTVHDLHHPTAAFHVAIDQQGWLYTAAQAGAYFSQNQGKTWNAYVAEFHTANGGNTSRIPHDYQRISLGVGLKKSFFNINQRMRRPGERHRSLCCDLGGGRQPSSYRHRYRVCAAVYRDNHVGLGTVELMERGQGLGCGALLGRPPRCPATIVCHPVCCPRCATSSWSTQLPRCCRESGPTAAALRQLHLGQELLVRGHAAQRHCGYPASGSAGARLLQTLQCKARVQGRHLFQEQGLAQHLVGELHVHPLLDNFQNGSTASRVSRWPNILQTECQATSWDPQVRRRVGRCRGGRAGTLVRAV